MKAKLEERLAPRAHLSVIALISFIVSFIVARAFATLHPSVVLIVRGIHIHHFWYGLAMLAVGGWLGISYNNEDTNWVAAILYGAGCGLIADEAGLLLTFGNYWSGLTYTFLVVVLAFVFVLFLLYLHWQAIVRELGKLQSSRAGLYLAVLQFAVSISAVTETTNVYVTTTSSIVAVAAIVEIVVFLVLRHRKPK
jgi:hypothetical protein